MILPSYPAIPVLDRGSSNFQRPRAVTRRRRGREREREGGCTLRTTLTLRAYLSRDEVTRFSARMSPPRRTFTMTNSTRHPRVFRDATPACVYRYKCENIYAIITTTLTTTRHRWLARGIRSDVARAREKERREGERARGRNADDFRSREELRGGAEASLFVSHGDFPAAI